MIRVFCKMTITDQKIESFKTRVAEAQHIVITAHKSPDGDSIGSSLGLYHYLKQINDNVNVCHPDAAPDFLHWMPGYDVILNLDDHTNEVNEHFEKADLIFCLDYNSPGRIGKLESLMESSEAFKIMIDHHRDPDTEFCELMFSDIHSCSTCQLIYEIIDAAGDLDKLNPSVGIPLYSGIMTDTGSFRFSSTLPKTHRIVADLMERGVEHWKIHENIYDTNSLNKLQLVSYGLLEKLVILPEYNAAYLSLTEEELKRFKAEKGDTEGLVNQILGINGVQMAIFLKEVDGIVKMSFRSKKSIPVNDLARNNFNGGGHLNAAGGKFTGSIENAIQKLVTILPAFVQENKDQFK